jgi:CheY-like chemotaxis protein
MENMNGIQTILLVDDSYEDYEATVRAFRKVELLNPVVYCGDAEEALAYLHRRGSYADPETSPRPSLIILDLNLPGTDGREVLRQIKHDQVLQSIPIVILTTSSDAHDVEACYKAGANSYLVKPVDMFALIHAMQRLKEYWFGVVILPKGEDVL